MWFCLVYTGHATIVPALTFSKQLACNYPCGKGFPEDIVAAVSFLLEWASPWRKDQKFVLDGGQTIC